MIGGNLDWKMIGIGALVGVGVILIDAMLIATRKGSLPPLAVGIGIYLPMSATFAVVLRRRRRPLVQQAGQSVARTGTRERLGILVASGLIVGERLFGVLNAGLIVAYSNDAPIALVADTFAPAKILGFVGFVGLGSGSIDGCCRRIENLQCRPGSRLSKGHNGLQPLGIPEVAPGDEVEAFPKPRHGRFHRGGIARLDGPPVAGRNCAIEVADAPMRWIRDRQSGEQRIGQRHVVDDRCSRPHAIPEQPDAVRGKQADGERRALLRPIDRAEDERIDVPCSSITELASPAGYNLKVREGSDISPVVGL